MMVIVILSLLALTLDLYFIHFQPFFPPSHLAANFMYSVSKFITLDNLNALLWSAFFSSFCMLFLNYNYYITRVYNSEE